MFTTTRRRQMLLIVSVLGVFALADAHAEIVKAEAAGFTLRLEVPVMAEPLEVYTALINRVSDWWHPAHTFSSDSSNLYIEAKAMGCFCERLPDGGSVRHMEVVFAAPGRLLRMQGGLGPLQSLAVAGSLSWHLHAEEAGTRVELRYSVTGYLPDGMDAWAKPVESVLAEQLDRLKNLIETGQAGADTEPAAG